MSGLELGLLGQLTVTRDGRTVELPRSRKTRALLAYLAAADKAQPRERLCAMFWDVPDDPRGALRWSLSKLRGVLDDDERKRIVGDRTSVAFDRASAAIDMVDVEATLARGPDRVTVDELERIANRFRGDFLEGLDLPRCPDFHAWCLAERERMRSFHAAVLRHLTDRLTDDPGRALGHSAALVRLDAGEEASHAAFVGLLARLGRRDEARRQAVIAERLLAEHGVTPTGALDAAWRDTATAQAARPAPPAETPAPEARQGDFAAAADGRPTIAVLPFEDMSGEESQRYFADGLTQDIATNLARFRPLLVIATQSSFVLRGSLRSIAGAREALGATYVLNGSVRRAGGRVRIVANLHDTATGNCLWSERYDRDVEDVFAIQDDIARQIAANLADKVASLAETRARMKRPESMVAYDHFLRGLAALGRYRPEDLRFARAMFEQALRLDPTYAAAMFGLAQVHINRWFLDADETALDDAYEWAMRALEHDPDDAWCAMIAGRVLLHRRDFPRARYYYERAVDLNPSCADILASYSYLLVCLGRAAEAVRFAREAKRLNPSHSSWYDENLGNALFARGDYEGAYQAFLRVPEPPAYVHGYMAAALARLGRIDEARAATATSIAMDPTQSIERHRRGEPFLRPEDMDDLLDALRLAGLPETHEGVPPGVTARAKPGHAVTAAGSAPGQHIQHCTTADGVRLAFATTGGGAPVVRPGNWLTHLEFDLESPVWRHWIRELSVGRTLVRYDERGNGLSDWTVEDLSFDALVRDLETVVDALGLDRFPLLAASRGSAVAIAFAARHPERVSRMVLYGGFARGWARRGSAEEIERRGALATLMERSWGQDNPWFRQAFTTLFIPDATAEQIAWFSELQRRTVSPRNARVMQEVSGGVDVSDLLHRVAAPTLVIHARDDAVVPFAEGRLLAERIPGARFVALDGRNHILLETEPAWPRFLAETRAFLAEDGG